MVAMDATAVSEKLKAAIENVQPIRDLAKNWDVDIASCLDEYLKEIVDNIGQLKDVECAERVKSTLSDGAPNFAQAALLLQNSSNVYSRKVEYLHSLVYATLEELRAKSSEKSNRKSTSRKSALDQAIDDFDNFDPHVQFLLLDDVLPTDNTENCDAINLKEDELHSDLNQSTSTASINQNSVARLSLGSLSTSGQNQSRTTASIAAQTLLQSLNKHTEDGNLRILSQHSDMSNTGVLCMPGVANFASNKSRISSFGITSVGVNVSLEAAIDQEVLLLQQDHNGDGTADCTDVNDTGAGAGAGAGDGDFTDPNAGVAADCDDDDGMMPFDDNNDDYDDDKEGPGFEMAVVELPNEKALETTSSKKTTIFKDDPWALLDPHDNGSNKGKPLRIGKTFRLPEGLDAPPSECVTGASTNRKQLRRRMEKIVSKTKPISIAETVFNTAMRNQRKRRERASISKAHDDSTVTEDANESIEIEKPKIPTKGLAFGQEFAYVAKATQKRKAAERRERRKLLKQDPSAVPSKEADSLLGYDDDDNGFGFIGNDDVDDGSLGDDDGVGNTGLATLDDAFEPTTEDESTPLLSFEELCRAHIRAFAKGAEKYKAETKLTRRVDEWQEKIAPILEAENNRPEFNIHEYGRRIVESLEEELEEVNSSRIGKANNEVNFCSLTRNSEQYEVCRLFLASLSLSNDENVVFKSVEGQVMTPTSLKLQLLDSDLSRPMETFMAPSALNSMSIQ